MSEDKRAEGCLILQYMLPFLKGEIAKAPTSASVHQKGVE